MRVLHPLRDRDFALLIAGTLTSLIGSGIFIIAIAFATLELSPGPGTLSIVGSAYAAGLVLFVLAGGSLADRWNKRRVLIVADVVRLVMVAAVAISAAVGALSVWQLIVLSFVYGAGEGFGAPAITTIVPEIVPPEHLVPGNALAGSLRPVAERLAGPAIGGLVVGAFGTSGALTIDAITFAVSIVCLVAMRGHRPDLSRDPTPMREGFRYVRAHPWLWATLAASLVSVLCFMGPIEVLLPVRIREDLHTSATALGLVLAAAGFGSLLGTLTIGQTGIPRRDILWLYVFWTLAQLPFVVYALADAPWQMMIAGLVNGFLGGAGTTIWMTLITVRVPQSIRGRVSAIDWLISLALLPVSFALTGPVADAIGVGATLIGAGLLSSLAVGALYLALPSLRAENGRLRAAQSRLAADGF